jgi:cob(I)alamin adenosyltransferase
MKIYTKKGDKGTTSLIGGTRVPKNHIKIEAYGTVDELNAWLGVIKDCSAQTFYKQFIENIQNQLFNIGSLLAEDKNKSKMQLPSLDEKVIEQMENQMDQLDSILPPLKNFVLPGGNIANSYAHVARCVCRRAERKVVELSQIEEVNPLILQFLNRLSDWLFVYSRFLSYASNSPETLWKP